MNVLKGFHEQICPTDDEVKYLQILAAVSGLSESQRTAVFPKIKAKYPKLFEKFEEKYSKENPMAREVRELAATLAETKETFGRNTNEYMLLGLIVVLVFLFLKK